MSHDIPRGMNALLAGTSYLAGSPYGLWGIIMVVVLFFRKGIMGDREITDLWKARGRKKAKKEAAK